MNIRRSLDSFNGLAPLVLLFVLTVLVPLVGNAVTFETDHLRLEISEDARLRSLVAKRDNIEYAVVTSPYAVATVYRGGHSVPVRKGDDVDEGGWNAAVTGPWIYRGGSHFDATSVKQQDNKLFVEFGEANVKATYRVLSTGDYVAFELLGVEGGPIDRIEFLRLNVRRLPMLGQWVNLAYDDRFGVCLCGGNLRTDIEMLPQERHVQMIAAAESAVGFNGAIAVLFGCRDPKTRFLDAMDKVERDFNLPSGATFRCSPGQRLSYLWASRPDPQNIDQYIRWAKLGGLRMILFSYRTFSKSAGHFEWNDRFPNGMADLKRVTDAIRAAGLKVGLHIHYSKAEKTDPYIHPVPDDRLHTVRTFTLDGDITADAQTLLVREDPAGCTLDKGRRLLKLGKELIEYENYTSQTPFQFIGCRRGFLNTQAAPQAAGTRFALLNVDTWPIFIRLDQNTDIQDEVARRLADIYHQSGPYEMVYFDGAEDVHEPFWYNTAASQYRVFRLLDPPPPVCEAAHYTHFSWHMISRANAYDVVAPPDGMKDFCRLMPCPTAAARTMDFSRIDFGWLGKFGRGKDGCAGPDVYEYIASRAAAWDCPVSLNADLKDFQSNPRAEDCLAAIKIWEDARLGDHLSDEQRCLLRNVAPGDARYVSCFEQRGTYEKCRDNRNLDESQRRILSDRREHHLFINEAGRYELTEVEEVTGIVQDAVKVFLFHRVGKPVDCYVLIWAVNGNLCLRLPIGALIAMRPFGTRLPCVSNGSSSELVVGQRTYLFLPNTSFERARQLLRETKVVR